jgi:hypothetical protein
MYLTPRFSSRAGGSIVRLLVFLVVLGAVVTTAWIFFIPMLLTSTLSKRTGFDVTVKSLVLNPFKAEVDVHGLLVKNPHTFPRTEYLDIPTFHARAPLKTLWAANPVIDFVRVEIQQITFVRNSDGTLNATLFYDRLFPALKEQKPTPTPRPVTKPGERPAPTKPPEPTKPPRERPAPDKPEFLIRRLELKLHRVVTDDRYSRTPTNKEFNLAIDQTFSDVTDPAQLFTPAVIRALSPVATAITGLIPGSLGDVLNRAVDTPPAGKDAKKKAPDPLKTISDTLEESRKP